jgi:chromate transporter
VLFVLPSLFILIGLSWVYIAFGEMPLVAGLFYGIKPAVTAIVLQAAHRIGSRALKNNCCGRLPRPPSSPSSRSCAVPGHRRGAALIGYIGGRIAPDKFKAGGGHGAAEKSFGPALIDDDTPTPAHARFRWRG